MWQRLDLEITESERAAKLEEKRAAKPDYREPLHYGSTLAKSLVEDWTATKGYEPGVSLGAAGLIVFDLDKKDGVDGVALGLEFLAQNGVDISQCPVTVSQGGGLHIYFSNPEKIGCARKKEHAWDLKGAGGQTISPGSIRIDGKRYVAKAGHPSLVEAYKQGTIPPIPSAIIETFKARQQNDSVAGVSRERTEPSEHRSDFNARCAQHELRLNNQRWPRFEDITDAELGDFNLTEAFERDLTLAKKWEGQGEDHSSERLALSCALHRAFPNLDLLPFAALMKEAPCAGKYGLNSERKKGHFGPYDVAREFEKGRETANRCERLYATNGAALGAVEGEADDADTPQQEKRQPGARLKSIGDFCAEYAPVEFVVDGIIERGKLYTLTARTGGGKTSLLSSLSLAVAAGRSDILGLEVERGRAVYCTFENPDDFRAKLIAAMQAHGVSAASVAGRFDIIDAHMGPAAIAKLLREAGGEPYAVVVIDTLQAAFTGANSNDNDEAKKFIMQFRKLRSLPGKPATLIAAHPIKSATKETLVPYGGGSVLNEIDGNLTLWREGRGSIVELHWLGKFRGMDFPPKFFQLESHETSLLDAKGRRLKLPVVRAKTGDQATERALIERREAISGDAAIIAAILAQPAGSLTDWGLATDTKKSTLRARLVRMAGDGLVKQEGAAWTVRPKGRRLLEEARADVERDGAAFEAVDEDEA